MDQTDIYTSLGVDAVVNAIGPATRLGGLRLHPDVVTAMASAAQTPVRISELQRAVGQEIARLLDVPGAYVTAGASAALQLAAAVSIASDDPTVGDMLPHLQPDQPHVVVVQAAHRDPYDRALESAGAKLLAVGYPESTHRHELARAVDRRTAAILYRPWRPGNHVSLPDVSRLARERGIPVIVDGALAGPPIPALRQLFDQGAAVVAVSGGKTLRGPQASGLLLSTPEFLERAAMHHQDMDEREATWVSQTGAPAPLRQGIGRVAKVGREQIVGLLAAVRRYADSPGGDDQEGLDELDVLESLLLQSHLASAVERHWDRGLGVP